MTFLVRIQQQACFMEACFSFNLSFHVSFSSALKAHHSPCAKPLTNTTSWLKKKAFCAGWFVPYIPLSCAGVCSRGVAVASCHEDRHHVMKNDRRCCCKVCSSCSRWCGSTTGSHRVAKLPMRTMMRVRFDSTATQILQFATLFP